ncbi:oxidoreductase [Staphylococcus pettenkoferi]|uniref:oxidoreductase n=1 Tax=Staphylococcus pettenkoferi TaxID=170573 RepID=UPI000CD20EAD|nr:oxidoreductase [Staphylococcus pettenkoferi]MCY1585270.1 oxidoreductase [Staphylococcus pettenkoferi]MCY1628089.1 oxidoreductase [Staphylococcus pettenkoferi]PNZ90454.1 2-dehydropantoate 2-reductase [Staphylococcus pettenkoferi]QQC38323.1 oxidoreductase [Staphylococcus pettenkoferi]UIK48930.1 oxidoreductase [Staphylococcus pettenkoferi]
MTRYGVVGPGAVGTTIAYELAQTGKEVQLLGRSDKRVEYDPGNNQSRTTLEVTDIKKVEAPFDVLFVAVKAHQLDAVMHDLEQLIDDNSIVILAQNGYRDLNRLSIKHIYQAVVYISGQKDGNTVTHFRDEILHLQRDAFTQQLKRDLDRSGLHIELEDNIETPIWYKLLVNLGINSVTALGHDTARVLKVNGMRELVRNLINDGLQVAQAEGIQFETTLIDDIMHIYDGYPDEMGTSMYYDIKDRKTLEIDYIQGYIYDKARIHNLNTPYLDTIYTLLLAHQV